MKEQSLNFNFDITHVYSSECYCLSLKLKRNSPATSAATQNALSHPCTARYKIPTGIQSTVH